MPKRVLILLAMVALAVAACGKNSNVSPTPQPSASFTPIPTIKTVKVDVTILSSPAVNVPVAESTPANMNSPRPGKAFATKRTGKKGSVTFGHLTPGTTYCWVATLGPSQQSSLCAGWEVWQTSTINIGT